MHTSWEIVFGYEYGSATNAQTVYDQIFKASLTYKFKSLKQYAIPVSGKVLTEAIFDLTAHDHVKIGHRIINGQKIKELFVTSIFLKRLETRFAYGDRFFIVIPETETSCDTAVMVAKADVKLDPLNPKKLKLPIDHYPFEFQIKEFFDFERMQQEAILTAKKVTADEVSVVTGHYEENVLVFMRDFMNYHSDEFNEFFKEHQNTYLISATNMIQIDGKEIALDLDKHNYVITFPGDTFSVETFNWPAFLVQQTN